MKTPRELLFERHQAAEPKLMVLRRNVLATLAPARARPSFADKEALGGELSLRELLLSFRWHLAGLGAAWLLVAFLNIDHSPGSVAHVAKENIPSPQQLLAALRENRRQLLELTDPSISEPVSAPPTVVPQRRGELQSSSAMV